MEDNLINIQEIIRILKKRRISVFIITLLFSLASALISFYVIKPKYEANTKFFIGKEDSEDNQGYSQSDVIMYQTLMKTYCEVIKTNDLLLRASNYANLALSADEILDKLNVITIADTQILEVSFKSENAKDSRNLIEGLTKEFISISRELFPNANVRILQKVSLPDKPVSPNKTINIAIGSLLGLIVSISRAFLSEFIRKIKTVNNIEGEAVEVSNIDEEKEPMLRQM